MTTRRLKPFATEDRATQQCDLSAGAKGSGNATVLAPAIVGASKISADDYPPDWPQIAQRIKDAAGWRCERCKHPHDLPSGHVLTVHHLDGNKSNCADWNLAALCQRCHLRVQGRVKMDQLFFDQVITVSEWFKPHLAGFLAAKKLPGQPRPGAMKGQMTMKTYQAILPMTTRRLKPFAPLPPPRPRLQTTDQLAHQIQRSVETVLMAGFWFCHNCDCICERIEGEQGQPAHCHRCHSPRIEWNPPIDQALRKEGV